MKHFLIASLITLITLSASSVSEAQVGLQASPVRLYRTVDQVIKDDSAGAKPTVLALGDVQVKPNSNFVQVTIAGTVYKYALRKFQTKAGTPYDTTSAAAAVKAYQAKLPGAVGGTATSITDYTSGTNTVATSGVFKVVVRNVGANPATVTYGGFTYTIAAGGSELFEQERDPKSGQRTPFLALVAIPATSTLRVIKYLEQ